MSEKERSKKLSENWPDLAKSASDALPPLQELKLHHYVLDALPGKCDEIEKQLEAYIKDHKADADAVKSLPAEAERLGKPVVVGMELARQRQTEMSDYRDRVAYKNGALTMSGNVEPCNVCDMKYECAN